MAETEKALTEHDISEMQNFLETLWPRANESWAHLFSMARRTLAAENALAYIDFILERRSALDDIPNRADKILYAISKAKEADGLERENKRLNAEILRLRDVCEDKDRHMVAYGKISKEAEAEVETLRAENARLKGSHE